jgi:hypothetical protein
MSDAISKLRRLGFGGNDNQQQNQQVNQAQSMSSQPNASQLPAVPSTQQSFAPRLDRLVPVGSPRFMAMLAELDGLSEIERAIVASRLVKRDDPILELKPEDWVALVKERIGDVFADAFERWLRARCRQ